MTQTLLRRFSRSLDEFSGSLCRWLRSNGLQIALLFVAAAFFFAPTWLYNLQNPDSRWIGDLYFADEWDYLAWWETRQGRWALGFVDALRGGLNDSAVLTRLPALLCYAAGAWLATDLLALRRGVTRVVAPLLLLCTPCLFEILTYRYCCTAYGLSFLLAVCAVAAVTRLPKAAGIAVGSLCLVVSLGLYQANLAVAAALCLMLCALRLLRTPEQSADVWRSFGRMALLAVVSLAGYCVVLYSVLGVQDLKLANYSSAENFGAANILAALPTGLARTYGNTARFFFGNSIVVNGFGYPRAYLLLFLAAGAAALLWLWRVRKSGVVLPVLAIVAVLPVALNCIVLIIPESDASPRTSLALLLVLPFALALAEGAVTAQKSDVISPLSLFGVISLLAAALLLRADTLQTVTDATTMRDRQVLYNTVAAQIYGDLLDTDGYTAETPLLIVGNLPNENFPDPSRSSQNANEIAANGLAWPGIVPEHNAAIWQNLYREELGLTLRWCEYEQEQQIRAAPEFAAQPEYPAEGALRWFGETLVVKVSEPG